MKCSVARDRLLPVMTVIGDVVPAPATTIEPMLAHVLLDLHDGELSVCGTDSAREVTGRIPVEEKSEAGKVTVAGRPLQDVCKSLADESMLEITLRENELCLDSGSYHVMLPILDAEAFPVNSVDSEQDASEEFSVPVSLLADALRRTHFCMAHGNARKFLNGVLWDIKEGKLNLVDCEGLRMALSNLCEVAAGVAERSMIMAV